MHVLIDKCVSRDKIMFLVFLYFFEHFHTVRRGSALWLNSWHQTDLNTDYFFSYPVLMNHTSSSPKGLQNALQPVLISCLLKYMYLFEYFFLIYVWFRTIVCDASHRPKSTKHYSQISLNHHKTYGWSNVQYKVSLICS